MLAVLRFLRNLPPPPARAWGPPVPDPRLGCPSKSSGLSKRSGRSHRLRLSFRASAGALLGSALLVLAGAGGATTAKAATVKTFATISTFLANHQSNPGALYFDLTVGKRDVTIDYLWTHVAFAAGNRRWLDGFRVAIRDGTAFGKERDLSGWRKASDASLLASGNSNGLGTVSPVFLHKKIVLKAGRTYGFRFITPSGVSHRYSEASPLGPLPPTVYGNADLRLKVGSFWRSPFGSNDGYYNNIFWHGALRYYTVSPVPLPAAAWLFLSALGALGTHRAWAGWRKRRPAA